MLPRGIKDATAGLDCGTRSHVCRYADKGRNRVSNLTIITVNDKQHAVSAKPDTPLLYVLRNELGLMAAKFGCGLAQCGVCSVLMDMREIRACVTPVSSAQGKSIITLEGLPALWSKTNGSRSGKSTPLRLHPIQQAWIDLQVPQCGYCQSGMMIQARKPAARERKSDQSADPRGARWPYLPVRHAHAGDGSGREGRPRHAQEGVGSCLMRGTLG
jgi:aerobic-type carbon monoxide dehydrogenase small subunit (CoxS/CutS family)